MWKKWLVFSLTFCLSLILWQVAKKLEPNNLNKFANVTDTNSVSPINENNKIISNSSDSQTIKRVIENRFEVAGVKNDKEVIDFYLKFQKAIAENNKKTVASMVIYPLRVNFPTDKDDKPYTFINDSKSFLKVYDKIFDNRLKKFIAKIDVENTGKYTDNSDIWAKSDGISVGRGVIWIGVYCNKTLCEDGKYHINIRTIHGNSNLMDLDEDDAN